MHHPIGFIGLGVMGKSMVGGDREFFDRILPLFRLMGKTIVYQGPAGSGQHCKLCNQIAIASNMLGVCEAMAYARRAWIWRWRVTATWPMPDTGTTAPRHCTGYMTPIIKQHREE